MRVITGTAKGCRLQTPAGYAVRPTSGIVKEAVFSALQFEIEGARVLDLFAGSGQMGIEALSRGARSCVLVDNAKESLAAIRNNLAAAGLAAKAKVVAGDAPGFLRGYRGEYFDIAFLDPPYAAGLLVSALGLLADKMSASGVIICETDISAGMDEQLHAPAEDFALVKKYRYGKTQVALYRRPGEEL